MFRRPIKEINAEFLAEEKFLDSIQQVVREACAAAGMPRKHVTAIQLAIEEGATNIIRHAYLYEKGTLRLRIVIYRKLVVFSLIDSGRSFQPDGARRMDLQRLVESGRRGGLGFYMVQKIMDSVEYISSAGFNELRMIKRIRSDSSKAPPLLRRMFTLRVKFSFWTFLVVSLIIGIAFYYVNTRTAHEIHAHLDETVTALTTTIADQAAGYMINRRSDVEFDQLIVSYKSSNPFLKLIVLTDSNNVVIAHSGDFHAIRKPYVRPYDIPPGEPGLPRRVETKEEMLSYLILPIKAGKRQLGAVNVTYSSAAIGSKLAEARRKILLLTAGLVLVGILGIYMLSSYFVTPIVKITRRVRRFSSGDLETELPLDGADEFFEISRALNDMITRLSHDRKNIIAREKMAKEIEVASQIQKTLLPLNLPELHGLEVDGFYRAASIVGGDLYDVFQISDTHYCLTVADVSGKGVPASLVMSMLRTVIQIYAKSAVSARATLLAVDEYLSKSIPPGMFITVLLGIYDSESGKLNFVSAGHNPMLLFKAGTRQLTKINPSGMPLGVPVTLGRTFGDSLEEVELDLEPGDVVFLYSDGITEATNREGQHYGLERLVEFVQTQLRNGGFPSISNLTKRIVDEIDSFSGFTEQNDDMTFILARTATETSVSSQDQSDPADSIRIETIEDSDNQPCTS